ncbi:hypothetical protein [Streptomyces sp. NPDC001194]|uniref:hypothetical protein n=1 Tax=Streptomyces sp. NPDC001194 TaxID=3364547 RepID=UPI00369A9BC9
MPYRPYPNAERALRQLDRHHVQQPAPIPAMRVAMADWAVAVLESTREATRPLREMIDAMQARQWHPDFIFDPATNRFEKWPAA